jgi:DNA-directed RNA polymerase specialized sigma24 family protein
LPDGFRDVLVAVDVAGLSYKETAHALGLREGTVMSRLYRARRQVVRRVDGMPVRDRGPRREQSNPAKEEQWSAPPSAQR